ncbi:MAG: hypothetical protein ACI9JM_000279 [Halioglobus sp.]|jgi:hypothetical protein
MINWGASLFGRIFVVFAFLFTFTACGGGGGAGGFIPDNGAGSAIFISMGLFDPDGQPTDRVTASKPGTLQVLVTQGGSGGPVLASVVVTVDTDIGIIVPASGTALTNSAGIATFQVEEDGVKGAGTITADAEVGDASASGGLTFQVGDSGLRLGYFEIDGTFIENQIKIEPQSTLSAGGNAQFSVVILNQDGERVTTAEEVRFNSGCIAAGQAVINPELPSTINGEASTLYSAAGCAGLDEITASAVGAISQAFGTITVAAPTTNSVNFVSAEPTLIVLKGTGGQNRDETSEVIFQVVDGNGLPLQGVTVDFSLSTSAGGLSLSTNSSLSDGDGQVKVTVAAGDIATTVRVIASVNDGGGEAVATVSDLLTVTTGLPDQNSISLSVSDTFGVEGGMAIDGLLRTFTVRMADKFNNPVVDGTAAVFTTEYGRIVSSCFTVEGTCSVLWNSQEPRFPTLTGDDFVRTIYDADYDCPAHNVSSGPCPADLGFGRGGRSTILVHAQGEESFIDRNGNGVMDEDERDLFENLPEAHIDHNEDGIYTPGDPECLANPMGSQRCIAGNEEIFIDFNSNEVYDRNDDPAVYNGLLCPPKGDGLWCSRELVHVRDQAIIFNTELVWYPLFTYNGNEAGSSVHERENQVFYISDQWNNPPPGGTTVSVTGEKDCEITSDETDILFNDTSYGAYGIRIATREKIPPSDPPDPGTFTVSFSFTESDSIAWEYPCTGGTPQPLDCTFSPLPVGCPDS